MGQLESKIGSNQLEENKAISILERKEPFYREKFRGGWYGRAEMEDIAVDAITRELEPLEDALWARRLEYIRRGERVPTIRDLLSKEEYNKLRRLKRRLKYFEELGWVEFH